MGVYAKILVSLLWVVAAIDAHCQTNTFITYEIGITTDEVTFHNPQKNVDCRSNPVGVPGFLLTQQLYQSMYIETGIYSEFTGIDMIVTGSDTTNLLFAQNELHIPLRLQMRQGFLDNWVDLFLSAGVTLAFSPDATPFYELYSKNGKTELLTTAFGYKNTYALMEFGMGVDVKFSKDFFAGIRYRHSMGLSDRVKIEAQTRTTIDTIADTETTDYTIHSVGSYRAFTIGVGYRISRLWSGDE